MSDKQIKNEDNSKEYTLKAPVGHPKGEPLLICGAEPKFDGDTIKLRRDQAERYKALIA